MIANITHLKIIITPYGVLVRYLFPHTLSLIQARLATLGKDRDMLENCLHSNTPVPKRVRQTRSAMIFNACFCEKEREILYLKHDPVSPLFA
jgi:hypothetical protein